MITPRRTRLVRVPDLKTFRSAISRRAQAAGAVIVPTRGAATQLTTGAAVTRDELYEQLHRRLAGPPPRLTAIECEVIAQAAARAAAVAGDVSFRLRPGLIGEMLRFYDLLRRQSQHVNRFEELITDALGADEIDRGARRMREQTRFLAGTFRDYERRVRESGAVDEHLLRERLIADLSPDPLRAVVVTVADWIADSNGLFVADFDLLTRIPGLESIEVIATERTLRSGFHERLHNWLPGIEEIDESPAGNGTRLSTVVVAPPDAPPDEPWWTHRDREEELIAVVSHLDAIKETDDAVPLDRVAVVFKQPLPYLYMAREVFRTGGIPYSTVDALPLAAEPTAAALDLLLECAQANFTRDTLVAVLRSPHFAFIVEARPMSRDAISALDRQMSDRRYLGDLSQLEAFAASATGVAAPAAAAAVDLARRLSPLRETATASTHLVLLLEIWKAALAPLADDDPLADRDRRAREAIAGTLNTLVEVHRHHHDPEWTIADLALAIRRAIGDQTFQPENGRQCGVRLLDDKAARYGAFDDVTIVGLVEAEWPERPRRNIFYPAGLLKALGWPSEKDRRAAADAHFLDLVGSAERSTTLSLFTLEDDAIVTRSLLLDEVVRLKASVVARPSSREGGDTVAEESAETPWQKLRAARTAADSERFHGAAGPPPPRPWSVSALETYLGCPFRFFAQHVLKLAEEPDDEEVMDPRRQGQFVHEVFERFFAAWQRAGQRGITLANLDSARAMFERIVDEALTQLPDAEAALERTRLLGSPAAAGLGEAVMRMEAERPTAVIKRLLEHEFSGEFVFATANGPRSVAIRGKADRLDLLADGTFRLIDYKLGWPPDRRRALQLPIYGVCAEQQLRHHDGRQWTLGEAAYLAFKGPRRVVSLFTNPADRDKVLAEAQERLVATVDAIAAGHFPPTPDDVYRCETCSYAAVCRKDYVGDV